MIPLTSAPVGGSRMKKGKVKLYAGAEDGRNERLNQRPFYHRGLREGLKNWSETLRRSSWGGVLLTASRRKGLIDEEHSRLAIRITRIITGGTVQFAKRKK